MKILELQFNLSSGGAERFTVDLSNELAKTDEVTLMCLKDDTIEPEKNYFYKFDISPRVKYVNLRLQDGFHLSTWWRIYKAIKDEQPDVVHFNAADLSKFCFPAILLMGRKVKFFETFHSALNPAYSHGSRRFFINIFGRLGLLKYIALSYTNYLDMKAYYPFLQITEIVNGRAALKPTAKFDAVKKELAPFRKDADTLLFIHVARYHEAKNQQLLIDAFNRLHDEGANVSLVILGAHFDSEGGKKLLSQAKEHIHHLGTRQNVADYLLCSDAFTLSSSWEGMPISLIEASLCGLPTVSTPVCGAVDLIKDKVNGSLSKDFTLECYLDALRYTISHYAELKANATEMAKHSPYTMEICAKKYKEYFLAGCGTGNRNNV